MPLQTRTRLESNLLRAVPIEVPQHKFSHWTVKIRLSTWKLPSYSRHFSQLKPALGSPYVVRRGRPPPVWGARNKPLPKKDLPNRQTKRCWKWKRIRTAFLLTWPLAMQSSAPEKPFLHWKSGVSSLQSWQRQHMCIIFWPVDSGFQSQFIQFGV